MRPAQGVLILAILLIAFLAYLTVRVWLDSGFDFLIAISLVILGVLGFGVLGALGSSSDE